MNTFSIVTDAAYIYTENSDGGQGKISKEKLMQVEGIYRFEGILASGVQIELPYTSGILIIQNASSSHDKALAVLYGSGNGTVLVPNTWINFFSLIDGKICVVNSGETTNYIVKNMIGVDRFVSLTFIR